MPVPVERAREWRETTGIAVPVWADPEKTLYAALGALSPRGTWTLRPAILWRGFVELLRGNVPTKAPGIDPLHQGVDCVVDAKENCFPMIPSGRAHNEMILGDAAESLDSAITEEGKVMV